MLRYHTFTLRLVALAAFLLTMVPAVVHAQLKVGTLDMNRIFNEYYKTKDAQAQLTVVRDSGKKEMDERVATLKALMATINKLNEEIDKPELSKEAKAAKTKERDEKINEARRLDREMVEFRSAKENSLQQEFGRKRNEIIKDIMGVVDDIKKSAGYDFIFDISGLSLGQVPVVLFAKDSMDFSIDVITALNKNAPKISKSAKQ